MTQAVNPKSERLPTRLITNVTWSPRVVSFAWAESVSPAEDNCLAEATEQKSGGAPRRNRTYDLPLRRGLLYPLSYRGATERIL